MPERIDYRGPFISHKWKLNNFQETGGTIVWHEITDNRIHATFTHPETGEFVIDEQYGDAFGLIDDYTRAQLKADVLRKGLNKAFGPIMLKHWLNYTKSHAGIPNDDPVFDQYKTGQIIYTEITHLQ